MFVKHAFIVALHIANGSHPEVILVHNTDNSCQFSESVPQLLTLLDLFSDYLIRVLLSELCMLLSDVTSTHTRIYREGGYTISHWIITGTEK